MLLRAGATKELQTLVENIGAASASQHGCAWVSFPNPTLAGRASLTGNYAPNIIETEIMKPSGTLFS